MKFEDIIQVFSREVGLDDPTLEEDGSVCFRFDDEYDIIFTPNIEDNSVIMYSELMDSDSLSYEQSLFLLEKSLIGGETLGCSFSIDPRLRKIIIWKRYDNRFEDNVDFSNKLNAFLGQVIIWTQKLKNNSNNEIVNMDIVNLAHL